MQLVRERRPRAAALDAAVTEALLLGVAEGGLPPTLRVYRPAPTLAFGRLDQLRPGFGDAVATARAAGFAPVLRSPGGHAAAYDADTVGFDLAVPVAEVLTGARERFAAAAQALARQLAELGVDARVGAVDGEYCRGDFSVNARGRVKLVGTAQRVIRGGALLGGFVTVAGADRLRAVLEPVYAALGLDWDPATLGAVADEAPAVRAAGVEAAVARALAPSAETAPLDAGTLARAEALEPRHTL